jgi:hypothetical protein
VQYVIELQHFLLKNSHTSVVCHLLDSPIFLSHGIGSAASFFNSLDLNSSWHNSGDRSGMLKRVIIYACRTLRLFFEIFEGFCSLTQRDAFQMQYASSLLSSSCTLLDIALYILKKPPYSKDHTLSREHSMEEYKIPSKSSCNKFVAWEGPFI